MGTYSNMGGGVNTGNIVDGAVAAVDLAAGAPHANIVVAAANASEKVLDTADYVCSGADDHSQIQSAIVENEAGTGGIIQLSGGDFLLGDSLTFTKGGTQLLGVGIDSASLGTTLKLADGVHKSMIVAAGAAANTGFLRISNLKMDGNKASNAGTVVGVGVYSSPSTTITAAAGATFTASMIGHNFKFDTSGTSYVVASVTSSTIIVVTGDAHAEASGDTFKVIVGHGIEISDANRRFWDLRIDGLFISGAGQDGINTNKMWGYRIHDVTIENCLNYGIYTNETTDGDSCIDMCKILANGSAALYTNNGGSCRIINNYLGTREASFVAYLRGTQPIITGNKIVNVVSGGKGILLYSATQAIVNGNAFTMKANTAPAIQTNSSSDKCVIANNRISVGKILISSLSRGHNITGNTLLDGIIDNGGGRNITANNAETLSLTFEHTDLTGAGTAGIVDFTGLLPDGSTVLWAEYTISEAFHDGTNAYAKIVLGDGSTVDRFASDADPGFDIWNSTTAKEWDDSDMQGTMLLSADKTPRVTITVDSDIADLEAAGATGIMTIKIAYRRASA